MRLVSPVPQRPDGSGSLQDTGQERQRIDVDRAGDGDEFRDIESSLQGFDALDPIGGNLQLACQLALGQLGLPAGRGYSGSNCPMAAGVFQSDAFAWIPGASITVSVCLIRNS